MLKALELAGFKSFADKTRLEFHAGVTCVVGPNGSGKSNVVDAIKWVLGSQSPKSLRGSEMTDVIFNGSAGRKPLNAAEVTLEFDNSTGLIDLKEPLVRITRRVLRSGEGEYAINGTPCRLRDLKTLLAGTGIGVESYNIIEQGRVDAVLNASAKDRRALFEEAAGVSRFRLKKQEAARRLARVEQNLLRLSDIVDEVEGRLRRVRMQAGKARRYREQSNRLKELRTELGLADWRVLTARLEELDSVGADLSGEHEQLAGSVAEGERRLEALEAGTDSAGDELAALDGELATVRERLASRQSGVASDTVRLEELEDALTHARRRLVATRIDAATRSGGASVVELRKKHAAEQTRLAEATAIAQEAEAVADSQATQLESLRETRLALNERRKTIDQALAEATREADRLAVRLEVARQQLAEHEPLLKRIESQHADAAQQAEECTAELQSLRSRVNQTEEAAAGAKRGRSDLREVLANARQQVARQEAEAEGERRQLAALEAADLQLDRLREEMARLLGPQPDSQEALPGAVATIRGLVADVMHVDFDTAPIIEAALGERAHHLVVDDGEALLAALDGQPEPLATRAFFQRLDARPAGAAVDRIDLSGLPGVMGRADRFVEADAEFTPLVTRLLGRTWIVDRLETAARLAKGEGQGLNFVTFDGETIAADGSIVAGPQAESAGVLTRRRQIAILTDSLESAEGRLAELTDAVAQAERRLAAAGDEADRLAAEHATLAARLSELGQRAAALGERRERLNEELRRISAEREKLIQQNAATEESIGLGRDRRGQWRVELEATDREREAIDKLIEAAERELAAANAAANEARVVIAGHEQHAEILAGQLAQLERDAIERTTGDVEAAAEVEACQSRVEACRLSLLAGRAEIAEAMVVVERLARRRRGLAESKRGEVERRQQLARALHEARRRLESVRARLNQSQLESERLRLERTALAERMRDDYAIDLAEAARNTPSLAETTPPEERATLEQELAQLRRQVTDVGAVNLDSLEELDELEERFAELSSQYNDLSEAKTSLERLSTRISTESRQLFLATVEEVRGHFRELFRRLFGGGEADILILEEQEGGDPLEAGVEIAASPPGKELRSISLLSGGEKTMTCVALLLAVFRTKPSPFCILDEVDAALDEANIGRFTGVLSEFLSSTQFVVVTHSKKTMTGADTLYGVTMQESGVSKQIAVRFEDVGEDGQINPAATLRRSAPERRAA